jgi:cation transport regulator ChaB
MYSPTDRRYISAMMVIDMAEKQDQQKAKDEEPADNLDNAPGRNEKTWDFLARSMPDQYKKEENPFRVTKEHLQRIIKEELLFVLEGYKGYSQRRGDQNRREMERAVAKSPMRQGRVAARAGGPKKYPEDFTEKQKESFDKGWDDEKSIMADEKKMKGESLEKTSVNEQ